MMRFLKIICSLILVLILTACSQNLRIISDESHIDLVNPITDNAVEKECHATIPWIDTPSTTETQTLIPSATPVTEQEKFFSNYPILDSAFVDMFVSWDALQYPEIGLLPDIIPQKLPDFPKADFSKPGLIKRKFGNSTNYYDGTTGEFLGNMYLSKEDYSVREYWFSEKAVVERYIVYKQTGEISGTTRVYCYGYEGFYNIYAPLEFVYDVNGNFEYVIQRDFSTAEYSDLNNKYISAPIRSTVYYADGTIDENVFCSHGARLYIEPLRNLN